MVTLFTNLHRKPLDQFAVPLKALSCFFRLDGQISQFILRTRLIRYAPLERRLLLRTRVFPDEWKVHQAQLHLDLSAIAAAHEGCYTNLYCMSSTIASTTLSCLQYALLFFYSSCHKFLVLYVGTSGWWKESKIYFHQGDILPAAFWRLTPADLNDVHCHS